MPVFPKGIDKADETKLHLVLEPMFGNEGYRFFLN